MKNKVELLAPAGDLDRLKIALKYGADAVYVGGPLLNLRANAINFTLDELREGVSFAHELHKKVYVTVNIILHNKELDDVDSYLEKLSDIGVDAIIISDPSIIPVAQKYNIEIHLSTQQSTLNYEAVSFWKKQGVTRIVLARECSKLDIMEIMKHVDIEIETFIHGAMCAGYSGRCVMSNVLTNRDANRGGCSQICRWDFNLLDCNMNEIKGDMPFTFCSKDLSMLKYIPDMISMGITSFKIEGRMRSKYYIATVVSVYRKIIDNYYHNNLDFEYDKYEQILRNCANRDSIVQFYDGNYDSSCSYYNGRDEVSNQDFLGIVLDYDSKTQLATIEQRNYFKKGDVVEFFGPDKLFDYVIDEVYDEDDNLIDIVRHPRQIVKVKVDRLVDIDDMLRIKK